MCKFQNKISFNLTENLKDPKNQFVNKLFQPNFAPPLFWEAHDSGNLIISVMNAFAFGDSPPVSTWPYAGAIGQKLGLAMAMTKDIYQCDSWMENNGQFIFFSGPNVVPCQQWDAGCQIYSNYKQNILGSIMFAGVEGPCPSQTGLDYSVSLVILGGTDAFIGARGQVTLFQPYAYNFLRYTFTFV